MDVLDDSRKLLSKEVIIRVAGRSLKYDSLVYDKKEFLKYGLQTGNAIWPSAKLLCDYLTDNSQNLKGRRVLELGCGLGLGASAAVLLGASEVTFSDGDDKVLDKTYNTAKINGLLEFPCTLKFEVIRWGDGMDSLSSDLYDVIIGSDLIYGKPDPIDVENGLQSDRRVMDLMKLVKQKLKKETESIFIMAFERREIAIEDFQVAAKAHKLACMAAVGEYFEDIFDNRTENETDFWTRCILLFKHNA